MFEQCLWQSDRMLLNHYVFRLQHYFNDNWELGDQCFVFYKIKTLIDEYQRLFHSNPNFTVNHLLELGLWEGGSAAFWFECLKPQKLVGVDIAVRDNSAYFNQYLEQNHLKERLKLYWGVSQDDEVKLRELIEHEFNNSLDLVIDDASHLYQFSKASFEILFPLLRPGGLYIIEDWAWGHWSQFQLPGPEWSREAELTNLVFELIQAVGTSRELFRQMTIFPGFVVIERGDAVLPAQVPLVLQDHIYRRDA